MLEDVEVREIITGVTKPDEIKSIVKWFWHQHGKDQALFPTKTISMDAEDVQVSLYDCYRLAGKISFTPGSRLQDSLDPNRIQNAPEDRWQSLPVRIMIGNGVSYSLQIKLNLERDNRDKYIVTELEIQPEILDFIESLPVCTGLGIKRDVQDIEFIYTLISRRTVSLAGYVDLANLALLAGYEFRTKSMTAMAVQVLGMLMNKCCSTGDNKWAWDWSEIPTPLQV